MKSSKIAAIVALALIQFSAQSAIISGTFSALVANATGGRWNNGDGVAGTWSYDTTQIQPDGRVFLGRGASFNLSTGPSTFNIVGTELGATGYFKADPNNPGVIEFIGAKENADINVGNQRISEFLATGGGGLFVLNAISHSDVPEPFSAVAQFIGQFTVVPTPESGSPTILLLAAGLAVLVVLAVLAARGAGFRRRRLALACLTLMMVSSAPAAILFNSGFSDGQNPLVDQGAAVDGSWSGDIVQDAGGFQRIGSLGFATSAGIAYSQEFTPVDFLPQGAFQPVVSITARTSDLTVRWRLSFYDTQDRSVTWTIIPVSSNFQKYTKGLDVSGADPGFDIHHINQFSIAGEGGGNQFVSDFDELTVVPEPSAYAAIVGCSLGGLAVWRKLRAK